MSTEKIAAQSRDAVELIRSCVSENPGTLTVVVLSPLTNVARALLADYSLKVLEDFGEGDILLLQNEISCMKELINLTWEKGLKIVLNPSPMNDRILACDLTKVSMFLMNEDEGQHITHQESAKDILETMRRLYPDAEVVLTLGANGSCYQKDVYRVEQQAFRVQAVDTTAASDTFTGYFLAALASGRKIEACLEIASKASAIAVTRKGAASSIPTLHEVEEASL